MIIELCYLLSPTSTHNSTTILRNTVYTYNITYTYNLPVGCHAMQPVGCSFYFLLAVSEGSTTKVGLAIADKSGLTR